ncbi:hypothetical protein GQ600_10822 [Phytophthora cactorum]|nr:hypothetical protein GQ600_10822 [Phytophthora cactorum]
MNESAWIVATEYFRLFRYGYMAPILAPQSLTPPPGLSESNDGSDVTDGNMYGVVAILENWKLFSLNGGDNERHYHLKLAASTVPASSPDQDAEEDEAKSCRRWFGSTGHFNWSRDSLESKVDLMTPMLQLLGSLEDVARVFDKALVTLEVDS